MNPMRKFSAAVYEHTGVATNQGPTYNDQGLGELVRHPEGIPDATLLVLRQVEGAEFRRVAVV